MTQRVKIYHAGGELPQNPLARHGTLWITSRVNRGNILIGDGQDYYLAHNRTFPKDIGILWDPRKKIGEANVARLIGTVQHLLYGYSSIGEDNIQLDRTVDNQLPLPLLLDMLNADRVLREAGC